MLLIDLTIAFFILFVDFTVRHFFVQTGILFFHMVLYAIVYRDIQYTLGDDGAMMFVHVSTVN